MHIIERKIVSKTGLIEKCEDEYCITDDYVCVIDGATDVSGKTYNGMTPGKIIAKNIKETIAILPPDSGIQEIIEIINRNLISYYKKEEIYDSIANCVYFRPTAAMALYSRSKNVIWVIGDCQCMVDGKLHMNEKTVDSITANARSLYIEAELQRGKTIQDLIECDSSTEAVLPFIRMQYYLQNLKEESQYNYSAIDGFQFNKRMVKTICVEPDAEYIILATDGYPKLKETLNESEDYLSYILKVDPLCFREYKLAKGLVDGNKSFDDRTYVKVKLK